MRNFYGLRHFMADKIEIIGLIQALAKRDSAPPSLKKFVSETGIKESSWKGKLWLNWNDAMREAGLSTRAFVITRLDKSECLRKYVAFVSEIRRIPTQVELEFKRNADETFPNVKGLLNTIGRGVDGMKAALEFSQQHGYPPETIEIFRQAIAQRSQIRPLPTDDTLTPSVGYVYLLKSGKDYKIGKTNDLFRRHGELKVQLPEKGEPIHHFETDDPSGIEAYWHNRFKDKRKNGEWFALDAADIKAFKRRKTFM